MICEFSWKKIQDYVKQGLGKELFPIGTQFVVRKSVEDNADLKLLFDVVDYDGYTDSTDMNDHSITLMMHDIWYRHPMDAREALFFCESDLPSGTYYFIVKHQEWFDGDNGKSFQFTIKDQVSAGSQLYLDMNYNETIEGKFIEVYKNGNESIPYQRVKITCGSEGTSLGITDGTSKNLNHMQRAIFGSNNYGESALRQWLNSDAPKGKWWVQQTRFDRPALYSQKENGFANGLEMDFVNIIRPVEIKVRHNEIYEQDNSQGNTIYTIKDRFFIPSLEEMGYDPEGILCGQVFQMYKDTSLLQRTKQVMISPQSPDKKWWLRAPKATNTCSYRLISEDGSLFVHTGYCGFGVAVTCVI